MTSFPGYLKMLRIQLVGKQAVLSKQIGCLPRRPSRTGKVAGGFRADRCWTASLLHSGITAETVRSSAS